MSRIASEAGDVVQGGVSILTVVSKKPGQVVGFLPESNARHLAVGMKAYLTRTIDGGPVVSAHIVALTPEILGLPNRVNPFPNQSFRGRRVILTPDEPNDFLPGESVSIELDRPWLSMLVSSFWKKSPAPAVAQGAK